MDVDTDSPQPRGVVEIQAMWKAARIIGAVALFLISGGLTTAKKIADWVGRSTFVEDAEALGPKAAKMFEWLAEQPTLTFYVIPLALAAVGIGLLFLPFPRASADASQVTEPTKINEAPDFHSDDAEAEALDKPAYNEVVAFCIDHLLPACDAQSELQNKLVRALSNNDVLTNFAIYGLRTGSNEKVREFWEAYTELASGLESSPGPDITFREIVECIHKLESGSYKAFCDQADELGKAIGADWQKGPAFAEWSRWRFVHIGMIDAYAAIARDIRFGKLHRLKPSRWGSSNP